MSTARHHASSTPEPVRRVVSPAPRHAWAAVHAADPFALVTQSPQWTDVIVETSGWSDASVLLELDGGRRLVVPMVRRTFGGASVPHASFGEGWGMGGVLAPGGPSAGDVAVVLGHLGAGRAVQTAIRPNPLVAEPWAQAAEGRSLVTIPKSAHVLDLGDDAQTLFSQRLKKNGRRDVRRAERMGVTVTVDASEAAIATYYELFLRSLARWAERSREPLRMALLRGKRRDPLEKFHAMASHLGDAMRVHIARVDGVPAAAAIVLATTNAHYTRGVMDVDVAGPTNAADLVQWSAIRDAAELGCTSYHMGESGTSVSLARFKEKFGARPIPYAQYRIERLPLTAADAKVRSIVKRLIGFQDA